MKKELLLLLTKPNLVAGKFELIERYEVSSSWRENLSGQSSRNGQPNLVAGKFELIKRYEVSSSWRENFGGQSFKNG
jgi:hypothetical protein